MKTLAKIKEYELIRGIAIIFVILGHSYQLGSFNISMQEFVSLDTNCVASFFNGIINQIIYSFHMPLYMILSGALAYRAFDKWEIFEYIKLRCKRLIIPFFVCGFFFSVPIKFIAGYFGTWSLLESYVHSLVLMETTGHLWFLFVLFLLDCIFIVVYKMNLVDKRIFVLIMIIAFLIHDYLPSGGLMLYRLCHFALYFYLGLMFEKKGIRQRVSEILLKDKILLIVLCIGIYCVFYNLEQIFNEIIPIGKAIVRNAFEFFQAISASMIIFMSCHLVVNKECKFVKWLSNRSFGIYLYHEPIIILCIWIFINTRLGIAFSSEGGYFVSIVLRFIVGLIGALGIDYSVKKCKMLLSVRGKK